MTDQTNLPKDPTINVKEMIGEATGRLDDLREAEIKRVDEKISANDDKYQVQFTTAREAVGIALISSDTKYQLQFNAAREAVSIALVSQEKAVAAALEGTKEAITKNDANTDKRFDLLSEKIDGVVETMSRNTGAQGIYVTHSDLTIALDKLQTSIEITLRPVVAFMNNSTGKQVGSDKSWASVVTIIGITIAVVTLLIKFV